MITAEFKTAGNKICGFRVSGHSGYADAGADIICSAVTSAVQLTVNAIAEKFKTKNKLFVDDNDAVIDFSFDENDERALLLAEQLFDELNALQNDYPENIRVIK